MTRFTSSSQTDTCDDPAARHPSLGGHDRGARFARLVVVVTLIALGSGPRAIAQAQSEPSQSLTAFVGIGRSITATGDFSDRLVANGYPDFGSTPTAVSAGVNWVLRTGLLLSGEWSYLQLGGGERQGRDVGLGGGYATLGVGYALSPAPRVRFFPRLGIGVGGMGLWSEEPDDAPDGDVAFDAWLANPNSNPDHATLSQASMVLDLGAGAEYLLHARAGGPLLGLRLGYVATPFDQGWTRDGRTVTGAPRATVAGPYARIVIGWRRQRVATP